MADSRAARQRARINALEAEKQRLMVESQSLVRRRQELARSGMPVGEQAFQKAIRTAYINQRALLRVEVALESARRLSL